MFIYSPVKSSAIFQRLSSSTHSRQCILFLCPQPLSGAHPVVFFPATDLTAWFLSLLHPIVCTSCPLSEALVSALLVETPVSPSVFGTVLACCLAAVCAGRTPLHAAGPVRRRHSHSGWWIDGERWPRLSSLLIGFRKAGNKKKQDKLRILGAKQTQGCNVKDKDGRIYLPSDAPRLPGPVTRSQHPMHWGKIAV